MNLCLNATSFFSTRNCISIKAGFTLYPEYIYLLNAKNVKPPQLSTPSCDVLSLSLVSGTVE